jgi:hypothetical protein
VARMGVGLLNSLFVQSFRPGPAFSARGAVACLGLAARSRD